MNVEATSCELPFRLSVPPTELVFPSDIRLRFSYMKTHQKVAPTCEETALAMVTGNSMKAYYQNVWTPKCVHISERFSCHVQLACQKARAENLTGAHFFAEAFALFLSHSLFPSLDFQ